jgi:small subunit ribosomal protein S4
VHLREKQKARQMYGVMEGQFRLYMDAAFKYPGITGLHLLRSLERRLDNVVFLLGFADSRKQARQMVTHGHFQINGTKTDIPSYQVSTGDVIAWKESDKSSDFYQERTDGIPKRPIPSWLTLNQDDMTGKVTAMPPDEELPQLIDSRLIVEFYSR